MDVTALARSLLEPIPAHRSARQALRPVLSGTQKRARISTMADITDEAHALVCQGTFDWSIRRP
jgi:hypothetical protein